MSSQHRVVLPTYDLAFKKILANPEHPEIIQGFIRDFLDREVAVDDIRILNPYSIDDYVSPQEISNVNPDTESPDGEGLLELIHDVTITVIETLDLTIEMQLAKHPDLMKRSHMYLADVYRKNYNNNPKGSKYETLKPVWAINILGFKYFPDAQAYRVLTFHDQKSKLPLAENFMHLGFFELPKETDDIRLASWRAFFNTGIASRTAPEYLQEAAKLITYQNLTPKERNVIDSDERRREWAESYNTYLLGRYDDGVTHGMAEGIAQGMAQGKSQGITLGHQEGARRIAKKMLDDGLPPETIAKYTGLAVLEIRNP